MRRCCHRARPSCGSNSATYTSPLPRAIRARFSLFCARSIRMRADVRISTESEPWRLGAMQRVVAGGEAQEGPSEDADDQHGRADEPEVQDAIRPPAHEDLHDHEQRQHADARDEHDAQREARRPGRVVVVELLGGVAVQGCRGGQDRVADQVRGLLQICVAHRVALEVVRTTLLDPLRCMRAGSRRSCGSHAASSVTPPRPRRGLPGDGRRPRGRGRTARRSSLGSRPARRKTVDAMASASARLLYRLCAASSVGVDSVATVPAALLRAWVAAVVAMANTRRPTTSRAEAARSRPGVVRSQRRTGIPWMRNPRELVLAVVGVTATVPPPGPSAGSSSRTTPTPS